MWDYQRDSVTVHMVASVSLENGTTSLRVNIRSGQYPPGQQPPGQQPKNNIPKTTPNTSRQARYVSHTIAYSVTNLGEKILWARPACMQRRSEARVVVSGGHPPRKNLNFMLKMVHSMHFGSYIWIHLQCLLYKAICLKIREILSITREPWIYGPCPTKSARVTEILWGLAALSILFMHAIGC